MADHLRTQIRNAVATALGGLATTGARVFRSRVYPLESADLPGLLVRTSGETSIPMTIHEYPNPLDRTLRLEVIAMAKAIDDLDATLDTICKEVETALANPVAELAGLAESIMLTSTDFDLTGTSEQPTGSATLTYEINYYTPEGAPDQAL